ncbi:hypothetical protein RCL1_006813 [Eukaryota sp. TZLM3-RCL]
MTKTKAMLSSEDMARMKNAELLFKTNLMGLQVSELLTATFLPSETVSNILKTTKKLSQHLTTLPALSLCNDTISDIVSDLPLYQRYHIPFPSSFSFTAPSSSSINTSLLSESIFTKPCPVLYLPITVPETISSSRPFSKASWLIRRHLYLHALSESLTSLPFASMSAHSFEQLPGAVSGVFDLVIELKTTISFKVVIKPLFSPSLFSLHSHLFSRDIPTYNLYNSIVASLHIPKLKIEKDKREIIEAFVLISIWFKRMELTILKNFDKIFVTSLVNSVLNEGLINSSHSSIQIFRICLHYWVTRVKGQNLVENFEYLHYNENISSMNNYSLNFSKISSEIFVTELSTLQGPPPETPLYFNILTSICFGFISDFSHVTQKALNWLSGLETSDDSVMVFSALFLTPYSIIDRYSSHLSFDFPKISLGITEEITTTFGSINIDLLSDFDIYSVCFAFGELIKSVLSLLNVEGSKVRVECTHSSTEQSETLSVSIYLPSNTVVSNLIKGPMNTDENLEQIKYFVEIFGQEHVKLRKFSNGDVLYSVLFQSPPVLVIIDTIKHVVSNHFGINQKSIITSSFPFLTAFKVGDSIDYCRKVQNSVDSLISFIRDLDLPLAVAGIYCIDPRYYGACPINQKEELNCFVDPIKILINFESITTWPKSKDGLIMFKKALGVEIIEKMKISSNFSIQNNGDLLVFYENSVYLITISLLNELSFNNSDEILGFPSFTPFISHFMFVQNFVRKFPIFEDCLITLKNLLSKFSISSLFSEQLVELICCVLFSNDFSEILIDHDFILSSNFDPKFVTDIPTSSVNFVVKFLKLISNFNYSKVKLIARSATLDQSNVADLSYDCSKFDSCLAIATPYDSKGLIWTRDCSIHQETLRLLSNLGKNLLKILGNFPSNSVFRGMINNQNLIDEIFSQNFNLIIHLKSLKNLKQILAQVPQFKNLTDSVSFMNRLLPNFDPYKTFFDSIKNDCLLKNSTLFYSSSFDVSQNLVVKISIPVENFAPKILNVSNLNNLVPVEGFILNEKSAGCPNILLLVEKLKVLGAGIVEKIVIV